MKLVQLTQEEEGFQGYATLPVYLMTEEGDMIEVEPEVYIIPGMSVPILLGEDFHLNYGVAVTRNVETGSRVHFGSWEYTVRAQSVSCTQDVKRILISRKIVGK
jgi:hypothetical protein